MPKLPSENRCGSKAMYRRFDAACADAAQSTAQTGKLIAPYRCPDCGMYHIGHASYAEQGQFQKDVKRPCRNCGGRIPTKRIVLGAAFCSPECRTAFRDAKIGKGESLDAPAR